jgi:hypothetical protein
MITGPEAYQAYRAVELHFDPSSKYDIRESKARVRGALTGPQSKNPVFGIIGRKCRTVGDAIAIFVHLKIHYSDEEWAPLSAINLLTSKPSLPETLRTNWANIDAVVRDDVMVLGNQLAYGELKVTEWLGLNPFNLDASIFNYWFKCPEMIISVIEVLDMWPTLMVQCNIRFKQSLYILDRYRSFLGESLVRKGAQMAQRHIDVQRQKQILSNADQGKSQQANQKEEDEWQALFQN